MRYRPTVSSCPKCGGEEYVIRLRVTGVVSEVHRFDGEHADNSEMWDGAVLREQKTIRCNDCMTILPSAPI